MAALCRDLTMEHNYKEIPSTADKNVSGSVLTVATGPLGGT